mmetsp:Transcript_72132/g.186091  ORF Transcript_72132/g.186091 Transcript_72132/m.186091 type:complete len:231 (-) Transcript_72132:67-759(-)
MLRFPACEELLQRLALPGVQLPRLAVGALLGLGRLHGRGQLRVGRHGLPLLLRGQLRTQLLQLLALGRQRQHVLFLVERVVRHRALLQLQLLERLRRDDGPRRPDDHRARATVVQVLARDGADYVFLAILALGGLPRDDARLDILERAHVANLLGDAPIEQCANQRLLVVEVAEPAGHDGIPERLLGEPALRHARAVPLEGAEAAVLAHHLDVVAHLTQRGVVAAPTFLG